MRQQQVSGISNVSWSKSNIRDSFYRLSNTWASYEKRVQDLLLARIQAELSLLISDTEQHWEVGPTEACPIVVDATYILELEREVQSAKAIVTYLPNMRLPQTCQLQVEWDASYGIPQEEPITDEPGSVTAQIVAGLKG